MVPVRERHRLQTARGARTTRAEMIAALIAESSLDPDVLEEMVLRYRKRTVGDVTGSTDADNVTVLRHGPGRRADPA